MSRAAERSAFATRHAVRATLDRATTRVCGHIGTAGAQGSDREYCKQNSREFHIECLRKKGDLSPSRMRALDSASTTVSVKR